METIIYRRIAMTFELRQKKRGDVTKYPISAWQLYQVGLYMVLENGQQLNLDRDKNSPRVYDSETGKGMCLQKFIKEHCIGGCHAK